jgi:hypothetical protein
MFRMVELDDEQSKTEDDSAVDGALIAVMCITLIFAAAGTLFTVFYLLPRWKEHNRCDRFSKKPEDCCV